MANIRERITRDGTKSYHVMVRKMGYPTQSATFKRRADALQWIREVEGDITAGRSLKNAEAKKHTLAAAIDRFVKSVAPSKSDEKNLRRLLAWWRVEYGGRLLSEVNTALLVEARDRLASGTYVRAKPLKARTGVRREKPDAMAPTEYLRAPATVNRYLAAVSVVLARCAGEWQWMDDNPVRRVTKLKEPRGRVRFLSDSERKKLLAACRSSPCTALYPIVVVALSAGARYGEILGLKWSNINTKRGTAILDETKNGERRTLPIAGHALELLKDMAKTRDPNGELLFPNTRRKDGEPKEETPLDIRPHWDDAIAAAKIKDFRFHDLRHSAASYLAMNGATIAEIADVLGHKTLMMVKRYSHLSEQHTKNVIKRMNGKIFV